MNTRRDILVAATIVVTACGPSGAVTQIEETHWFAYRDEIPTTGALLGVGFVARATAVDIASGVSFSVQERDPDGNDTIVQIALPWAAPHPAVGTEARVNAHYRLACSDGHLVAEHVADWFVSWCDPQLGTQVRSGLSGTAVSTGTSEPEDFEFVLVDENGVEAPGPTPEDAYHCVPYAASAPETPLFPSPYELVQAGLSIATEREPNPFPRHDPEIQAEYTGAIQIAFDPVGQRICGDIPAGSASTLYVVARAAGPTLCGITGAELRVVGMPAGWFAAATASPLANVSVGDPLGPVGGNMAYMTCQSAMEAPVLLYTIQVFATTTVADHTIEIAARNPPANPLFACPLVTLCDAPLFTIVCMTGSAARINPPAGAICDVSTVGLEPRTWTAVKDLYK